MRDKERAHTRSWTQSNVIEMLLQACACFETAIKNVLLPSPVIQTCRTRFTIMRTLLFANSTQSSSFVLQSAGFCEPFSPRQLANLLQRVHGLLVTNFSAVVPQSLRNSWTWLPVIKNQLMSEARAEIDEHHGLFTIAIVVLVPTIHLVRVGDMHAF